MHVIGTAGHVDHGKSTLVRALTGIDPDRFDEEKRRGLTIDLGFAWCTLPSGREVGIVDVPGHERFIRNMLAGVGAIEAALFVVAADEGWMPQSAEHLQILDFLGVDRGVVALTKTDIAADLADVAEEDVREHLSGTSLEGAPIVRVSATSGDGLDELLRALDGVLPTTVSRPQPPFSESLVITEYREGEEVPDIDVEHDAVRVRLYIDRSFTIAGAGAVVTGTLTGGSLHVGDEVTILPQERRARIRSLQTHGEHVEVADAPRRLALNLVGVDRHLIRRGDVIVTTDWPLSDRFAARIRPARDLDHPLKAKGAYELFTGSAQTRCRLRFIDDDSSYAEVRVDGALPLVPQDRFVIRDLGRWETVAGGVVIDAQPPRMRAGDTAYLDDLREREQLRGADLTAWLIRKHGVITDDDLETLSGVGSLARTRGTEEAADTVRDGFVFARGALEAFETQITEALQRFHANNPLAAGMPMGQFKRGFPSPALDTVLDLMQEDHKVVIDGSVARLPNHKGTRLTVEERLAADKALGRLRDADASPPEFSDAGISTDLARALERNGELVFLTPAIAYPSDVWADIEKRVVGFITDNGSATVAQIRDAVGTTRKYAVPLLEKLDATGVTRRKGDVRELGPRGRELEGS